MEQPTIGQRIRQAREARGWNQTRLAEEMCAVSGQRFDQSWVSQIETDARNPGAKTLAAVRAVLDLDGDELLNAVLDSAA